MVFKSRIVYVTDDNQIIQSRKELEKLRKEANLSEEEVKKIEGGFKGVNKEVNKTSSGMKSLGNIVAGLGIAAIAQQAAQEFLRLSREINETRRQVTLLTNETGKQADFIVAKVRATAQVYDKDFNEVLRAANSLSKEFDISFTSAINKINEGMSRGLDINGEYLETLKEYSSQVRSAGFDADQFNDLIQTSVREGIFSDKGIDVVKEGALRIREMTKATKDALKTIQIDGDQMQEQLRTGQITIFEAIQQVSRGLEGVSEDSAETGAILADVFGGPGEDAGIRFVKLLADIDGRYAELNEDAEEYRKQLEKEIEATEKLELAWTGLLKDIQPAIDTVKSSLTEVGSFLINAIRGPLAAAKDVAIQAANEVIEQQEEVAEEQEKAAKLEEAREKEKLRAIQKAREEAAKRAEEARKQQAKEQLETRKQEIKDQIDAFREQSDLETQLLKEEQEEREALEKEMAEIDQARRRENLEMEEEAAEKRVEIAREEEERKRQLREQTFMAVTDLIGSVFELQNARMRKELENENITEKRRKQIQRNIAENEKKQAIFSTIVNTAEAIVKALPNIPLVALVSAIGAVQLATIASQPVPRFAKGGKIKGRLHSEGGTLIEAERDEYVVNRQATMKAPTLLEKINRFEIDDSILKSRQNNPIVVNNDFKELIKRLDMIEKNQIIINERGFHVRSWNKYESSKRQENRFVG